MIRIVDTVNKERQYAVSKCNNVDLLDIKARKYFSQTLSVVKMKCIYGRNPQRELDNKINKKMKSEEYPQCSEIEDWEHVVTCRKTINLRNEFYQKLVQALILEADRLVSFDNIEAMINDIKNYLNNNDEYEMN